jgi:hypothetical protein
MSWKVSGRKTSQHSRRKVAEAETRAMAQQMERSEEIQ